MVCNKNPMSVSKDYDLLEVKKIMLEKIEDFTKKLKQGTYS